MHRSLMYGAMLVVYTAGFAGAQTQAPAHVTTPAEQARGLRLYAAIGLVSDDGQQRIPRDQLDSMLIQRASAWVAALQKTPVAGLQLDPMGELYVTTGHDTLAMQQFTTRLGSSRLSVDDQAFTLLLGVGVFSTRASNTARMQIARDYLARLDALPVRAIRMQFLGHVALARSYYYAGDGPPVVAELQRALALVPAMPFAQRQWIPISDAFLLLADVLSGMPRGRAQIDSMAAWLLPYTQASPALVAIDSAYAWIGHGNVRTFRETLQMTGYLGRPAPAIAAHYWWNVPAPPMPSPSAAGAMIKSLDDGTIRVVEFGHKGCPACMAALPVMDRMRNVAPQHVDVWFVSQEGDGWGATRCTVQETAQHLKHFYTDRKGYRLPIAVWIGPRVSDIDGGSVNQESPTFNALAIRAQPTFIVTDGHGIVRHISVGLSESLLERTVQYLVAEAARSAEAPLSVASPTQVSVR